MDAAKRSGWRCCIRRARRYWVYSGHAVIMPIRSILTLHGQDPEPTWPVESFCIAKFTLTRFAGRNSLLQSR